MPAFLLDLLYLPAALLYLPLLLYQILVLKKNRRGWSQRFGFIPKREGDRTCIWIHAVSLGEVNAARRLVAEIEQRLPDCAVVISATTDTGYAAARRNHPDKLVFRYPLDFSFAVRRALRRIRPRAIVLMELEVWPNLIAMAADRGIPVGIANGRVTEGKSMQRFRLPLVRAIGRRMFSRIAWCGAQNEQYAARFEVLGVPRDVIAVTGTMKFDTAAISDSVPGDGELAEALGIRRDAPLIVAGSTGPGEEAILLDAFAELRRNLPALQMAIVPRKPERFEEVARLIEARGLVCRRRSNHSDRAAKRPAEYERDGADEAVLILGDTMGELRKFYALAHVVFIGRSLVPMGGSDPIEAVALGKPTCFGPHMDNFAEVADRLCARQGAVKLNDKDELASTVERLLRNTQAAAEMGARGVDVVRRNTGATKKTVDLLIRSLPDHRRQSS